MPARERDSTLNEVSTVTGFKRLITAMDLPRPSPLAWVKYLWQHAARVNLKSGRKKALSDATDFAKLEREVEAAVDGKPVAMDRAGR